MYVTVNLAWVGLVVAVAGAMWCVHRYPRAVMPIGTGVAVASLLYMIMIL